MWDYEPRGAARELLLSKDPAILIAGAAGTGKSVAMLVCCHIMNARYPGTASLLVRATQVSLARSTLVTFEKTVAAEDLASGKLKFFGGSGSRPACYEYANGSRLYCGGMDRPGAFLSMDLDRVYCDESSQLTESGIETLITRLRGKSGAPRAIVMATNPDHPEHHLKRMADEGRATLLTSVHADNPYLANRDGSLTPDGVEYLSRLDGLTGARRDRYRLGRWSSSDGAIYDMWDPAVHVVDPYPVPEGSRWVESVDFGFQHAMAWGRFALTPDGEVLLVKEMSRRNRLVEDFAADILEAREENGWGLPEALVTDHAAGDRATLERYLREPTTPARKAVQTGLQAVQSRLMATTQDRPGFRVFRDSLIRNDPLATTDGLPRGFAAEAPGYVWAPARTEGGIPREEPLKINDDAADMVRYAVMHLSGPAAKAGNPARGGYSAPMAGSKWGVTVGKAR